MDIHEIFDSYTDRIKKLSEDIENISEESSSWDLFEAFLGEIIRDDRSDYFKRRLISMLIDPYDEGMEHHQKLQKAHQMLCSYDYGLKEAIYTDDALNEVHIRYDDGSA